MFVELNKNYRHKIPFLSVLLAMSLVSGGFSTTLAADLPMAIGSDTIAGQATEIKVKNFQPNELVNLAVTKPDKVTLSLSTKANTNGSANAVVYDYHTQKSGSYSVVATANNGGEKTVKTTFQVFPTSLDGAKSTVMVDRAVLKADGLDKVNVSVSVLDSYGNALDGHSIKLVSSRKEDQIKPDMGVTDDSGQVTFTVSSSLSGLANLLAIDLGEDIVLEKRVGLSFVNDQNYLADAGGDFIKVANAATAGPLSGFEIFDLPPTLNPNENISFKVKAVDAEGNTVEDYTGTIRFSAEGDNSSGVVLPVNYKFLAEDLGQHNFNLGLSFAQAGTYKIVVNDLDDKFKQGDKSVVVGGGGSSGSVTTEKPTISTPVPGTYSQAEQTISGSAKSSSTIKIYDNNQEIGSVPVGPSGKFSFQTADLVDGKHSIYVSNVDTISLEVVGTSDPIEINIDTTPPPLEDLQLEPTTGIKAGSVINVKVFSEKSLAQAAVIFNFDIIPLTASVDDATVYLGTVQAPAEAGVYKMNVLLVDELQNEKTYEDQATITVDPNGGSIEQNDGKTTTPTETPTETVPPAETPVETPTGTGLPSQVSGLIAYGSDKRVTLVWDAATDDKQIKNYKISYGQDVKALDKSVLTKEASTTWYIPDLENGKEYFFSITAIDNEGNESATKSEIVSGIPFMLEIKNALTDVPTQSIADLNLHPAAYSGPYPAEATKTGPELMLVFGATGALSAIWHGKKKYGRKRSRK